MKMPGSAGSYSAEARRGMAVLAAAALLFAGMVYMVFAWHSEETERLREAQSEHEMVAARAAKAAAEGAARLTAADNVMPMFLEGDTPGLAFATFQSIAAEAAGAAGLAVKRMQPLDTGDAEGAMPYRLSIDVEGSIGQLRDFLAALESNLPVMFVTGLEIQPVGAAAQPEGGGAPDQYPSEALRATLRVEAYGGRSQP